MLNCSPNDTLVLYKSRQCLSGICKRRTTSTYKCDTKINPITHERGYILFSVLGINIGET